MRNSALFCFLCYDIFCMHERWDLFRIRATFYFFSLGVGVFFPCLSGIFLLEDLNGFN